MAAGSPEQHDKQVIERMAENKYQCPAWVWIKRSCGAHQWVPAPCCDPCCGFCQKVWASRMRERWLPILEDMQKPKLITLTIPSSHDLSERVDYESKAFRRFLDTRLGKVNWPKFKQWSEWFLEGHLNDHEPDEIVRQERYENGVESLEKFGRRLKRFEGEHGKSARVRDVVGPGFSSREVTWDLKPTNNGFHLHRHLTVDSWFIPWHLLVVVWLWAGGGWVADIRPVKRDSDGIFEAIKYVTKFWEIPEDKRDEVRAALKGKKKIWPLGGARPADIDHLCPDCKTPECVCEEYRLGQTFRKWTGEDGRERMRVLVYGVFDETDRWVTLVKDNGRWREVGPSLDEHVVCVPSLPKQEPIRAGPGPPVVAQDMSATQYQLWIDDIWN